MNLEPPRTNTIMAKSYPMSAGNGPQSYAQNSSYQKSMLEEASRLIYETITEKLELELEGSPLTIRIADLGCSTGPNTFAAVQNIIEALQPKLPPAEFQVLFNDHVNNDFNTLLRSLPSSRQPEYFAAAVPGSFHGRLFPRSSLHFVHSSTALQWLSDVPRGVAEKGSSAWNSGSIYCTGLVQPVQEAYSVQFRTDFLTFLRSRAEEVVSGGWIAVVMPGRPQGVASCRTTLGVYFDVLAASLTDLTNSGLIDGEKVESFNIPLHLPTVEELAGIVMDDGSFSIEKAHEMTVDNKPILTTSNSDDNDKQIVAEAAAGAMRAVSETLIRQHFKLGDDEKEVVNQLFKCYATKVDAAYDNIFNPNLIQSNILLMLKRN